MCQADSLVAMMLINTFCTQNFHFLGGLCMRQYEYGAIRYSSHNKKVIVDPTACYGCGVCRLICNKKAITLSPRERMKEAPDLWWYWGRGGLESNQEFKCNSQFPISEQREYVFL